MLYNIFICLLTPIFDSLGNIVDSKLSNSLSLHSMVFYSVLINFLFLPIIFIFGLPQLLSLELIPLVLIVSLIEVFYLYPYTISLRNIDTSIVTALFSLGKIFVPILAFVFVGEKMSINFYLGFGIIIIGSFILSITKIKGKFKINIALIYMLGCSLILSVAAIINKYCFINNTDWITLFFWNNIFGTAYILPMLLIRSIRHDILKGFKTVKQQYGLFLIQGGLASLGVLAGLFAVNLLPVSFVKAISSLQSFITLLFGFIIYKLYPSFTNESFSKSDISKKLISFSIIMVGIILVNF